MPPILFPFLMQVLLAIGAFFLAPRIARAPRSVWGSVAALSLASMLLWPLMRFFPVAPIDLLGARVVACIELTGLAIPATLFFGIAARHVPKGSDRRGILWLTAVAGVYFLRAGWWMISPGVPDLGATKLSNNGICRQTTEYTCVAASMVTMLRAHGIPAEETEMARLAHSQVNGGATDSRTLWALETKLKGTPYRPRYQRLSVDALISLPKPCMVQLDWGFFISHMVPVMSADEGRVVIGDPLSGERDMTMAEFRSTWKGNAISLERVD